MNVPIGQAGGLIRLFEREPELVRRLSPAQAAAARRDVIVRTVALERGEWRPPIVRLSGVDLGALVLDGLVVRRIGVGDRWGVELLGAGDVVRPWHPGESTTPLQASARVRVCEPATFAVLDQEFVNAVTRWPGILHELLDRMSARVTTLALQLAVAQMPRLEDRILCVLWQLADRWGRVGPEGVTVPIALSQQTLADLTCSRRPSVSTALGRLMGRGVLDRPGRAGVYRLKGAPPDPDEDLGDRLLTRSLAMVSGA